MGQRLLLHEKLKSVMGANLVYFQPPANVQMKFPCLVYERSRADTKFADNRPYLHKTRYTLTVIDRNPDSEFLDPISELPMCVHRTFFTADNLNHDVYDIYF